MAFFSVHHQVRIKPEDEKGIENLSQISDQRETSIYYTQHILELKDPIYRGDGNSAVSFEDEPWKEQEKANSYHLTGGAGSYG